MCVIQQGSVHLLNANGSGEPLPLLAEGGASLLARCARFDASGSRLLTGGDDKVVRCWDVSSATCVRSWTHSKKIGCVEVAADGSTVIWADRFGEVFAVPLDDAAAKPTVALGHLSPVSHLRLSPCGTLLISADREGHVRSSCWPHTFVIGSFYLSHTSPLQLALPLAHAPLLITAASNGHAVCLWKMHSGALVQQLSAGELWRLCCPDGAASAEPPALGTACECVPLRLVALGFAGDCDLRFVAVACSWDAVDASLSPRPDLALRLPSPALALESNSAGALCVLTAHGLQVYVGGSAEGGFVPSHAVALPPPPENALVEEEEAEEAEADD